MGTHIDTHTHVHTHAGHGFCSYLFLICSCSLIPRPLLLFFSAWNLILLPSLLSGKVLHILQVKFHSLFPKESSHESPSPCLRPHARARAHTHTHTHIHTGWCAHTQAPLECQGLPHLGVSHSICAFSSATAPPGPQALGWDHAVMLVGSLSPPGTGAVSLMAQLLGTAPMGAQSMWASEEVKLKHTPPPSHTHKTNNRKIQFHSSFPEVSSSLETS